MTDFIDRAKLEAAMLQVDVAHFASKKPSPTVEDYATAVLALLDAETTEDVERVYEGHDEDGNIRRRWALGPIWEGERAQTRRVLYGPWLPSEGGES